MLGLVILVKGGDVLPANWGCASSCQGQDVVYLLRIPGAGVRGVCTSEAPHQGLMWMVSAFPPWGVVLGEPREVRRVADRSSVWMSIFFSVFQYESSLKCLT